MVLSYIDKHKSIKRADMKYLRRISKDQAYKLLNCLRDSGAIIQIGDRKATIYQCK